MRATDPRWIESKGSIGFGRGVGFNGFYPGCHNGRGSGVSFFSFFLSFFLLSFSVLVLTGQGIRDQGPILSPSLPCPAGSHSRIKDPSLTGIIELGSRNKGKAV